jgi:hypothetical protein
MIRCSRALVDKEDREILIRRRRLARDGILLGLEERRGSVVDGRDEAGQVLLVVAV